MKNYFEFRQELNEGKVGPTKLKAGMKVKMAARGSLAKRSGFKKGQNPYGDNVYVQILGFGTVPMGKKPEKRNVIAKDIKDFRNKYKNVIKDLMSDDDYDRGLSQYNAAGKLRVLVQDVGAESKKFKPGYVSFIYKVLDGKYKNELGYLYVSSSIYDKWAIYWSDDMEVDFFT